MKILMVLGGGIGNIVQATPAIQAISAEGHSVDLLLHCNSSKDLLEIFSIRAVRKIYLNTLGDLEHYDFQLNGPFTPAAKHPAKRHLRTRVNYAQHIAEAEVYYDLAKQIGVKTEMLDARINVGQKGKTPDPNTIAIYPGSKPDWAMKRWNKFDKLAEKFDKVIAVGTKSDLYSHGNPTWITTPWNWPEHVEFFSGTLQECAFLISKCKAFIGNDGGLSHVAAATGIQTFVLFGPSSDIKNKPYTKDTHVVAINLLCRPCQFVAGPDGKQIFAHNKADCPNNMKCMRDMSVDYVYSKVMSVIGE